ncbi:MAG: energy transducer TonB [Flavobacteriales bacterium]|nr:energy transducer TonB [Flavobacteriales bacterium]
MKVFFGIAIVLISCGLAKGQHSVLFKNGDSKKGIIMELRHDTLFFVEAQKMKKYHISRVKSLFFDEYIPYDGKYSESIPERTMKSGTYIIRYRIKDRKMITAPVISNGTEQQGRVVVDIVINRNGNVIKAKAGANGSTTSSEYLYTKAKFAAQGARFDVSKTGPVEVEGTITIDY